jgi:ribosomal protein S18 acetylase RimI-like enzyme
MVARALEPTDLKPLKALRLEGVRRFPYAFILTEAEAIAASDDGLLSWIASGGVHGLFEGDTLIGFAGLSLERPAMARHRAHLGPFYVALNHHGTGAADALLQHLLQAARSQNATQVELYVAASNPRARAFYARHGFAAKGMLPSAVIQDDVPQDDVFMVADLTQPVPTQGPDGLRQLQACDWRIFRDIRIEMLRDAPRCFGSPYTEWAAKPVDEVMAWLTQINLWALVEGGQVVATAGWHPLQGDVLRHRGHVVAVYTSPKARGRGLSGQLLEAAAKQARTQGIVQLELDVGAENEAAIAVYKATGYQIAGTIPNCLNHDGYIHDQHLMIRPLTA